jgi:ribonucleoside-triphosphate reductase
MCINFSGNPLSEEVLLVRNVLEHINQWCLQTQEETGYLWNVEMVPGEGSCYRLAKIDRKMYPDMFTQGTEEKPYYTTLLIPPNQEISLFERIRIDEQILPIFTGGTASRIYLGEKANSQSAKKLMKRIVSKTKIPYLDYTSTFSICKKEGKYIEGVIDFCPTCNSEVNVFSRVVGYYRSLNRYNPGKAQEFSERRYVTNPEIIEANVKQRTYRSELVAQPMITMD